MREDSESSDRFFTAFGLRAEAASIAPGLHVVATPIGNLKDISFRALETLAAADHVIAEDTRTTKVLLSHYGVSAQSLRLSLTPARRLSQILAIN